MENNIVEIEGKLYKQILLEESDIKELIVEKEEAIKEELEEIENYKSYLPEEELEEEVEELVEDTSDSDKDELF